MTIESGFVELDHESSGVPTVFYPGAGSLVNAGVGFNLLSLMFDGLAPSNHLSRLTVSRIATDATTSVILSVMLDKVPRMSFLPSPLLLNPGDRLFFYIDHLTFGDLSYVVDTDPVGAVDVAGGAVLPGVYIAPAPTPVPTPAPAPIRKWWEGFI